MSRQALVAECGPLRCEAYPNGTNTVPVAVFVGDDRIQYAAIRLPAVEARAKFAATLPTVHQETASTLLADLGLHVARAAVQVGRTTEAGGIAEEEPWPDPVDGAVLLDELRRLIEEYVVVPKHAAPTLA